MNVVEMMKLIAPKLSLDELFKIQNIVQMHLTPDEDKYIIKNKVDNEIKNIWQNQGKLAAVKAYKDHKSHIHNPGLKEAKDYVEELCEGIEYA